MSSSKRRNAPMPSLSPTSSQLVSFSALVDLSDSETATSSSFDGATLFPAKHQSESNANTLQQQEGISRTPEPGIALHSEHSNYAGKQRQGAVKRKSRKRVSISNKGMHQRKRVKGCSSTPRTLEHQAPTRKTKRNRKIMIDDDDAPFITFLTGKSKKEDASRRNAVSLKLRLRCETPSKAAEQEHAEVSNKVAEHEHAEVSNKVAEQESKLKVGGDSHQRSREKRRYNASKIPQNRASLVPETERLFELCKMAEKWSSKPSNVCPDPVGVLGVQSESVVRLVAIQKFVSRLCSEGRDPTAEFPLLIVRNTISNLLQKEADHGLLRVVEFIDYMIGLGFSSPVPINWASCFVRSVILPLTSNADCGVTQSKKRINCILEQVARGSLMRVSHHLKADIDGDVRIRAQEVCSAISELFARTNSDFLSTIPQVIGDENIVMGIEIDLLSQFNPNDGTREMKMTH